MKIQIQEGGRSFQIKLPSKLLFSSLFLRLVMRNISVNGFGLKGLSAEAADRLAWELKRVRQKHGTWDLVEVQAADGETVKITV